MSRPIFTSDKLKAAVLLGSGVFVALCLIGLSPSILFGPSLKDVESQIVDAWKSRPTERESEFRSVGGLMPTKADVTSFKVRPSRYSKGLGQSPSEMLKNPVETTYWPIELTIETTYQFVSKSGVPGLTTREEQATAYAYRTNEAWTVMFYAPFDETPWWKIW